MSESRPERYRSPQYLEARETIRSLYDPGEMADTLNERMKRAVERNFEAPITSRSGRLRFERVGDIRIDSPKDPFDYATIANTLGESGTKGTYGSNIRAKFRVVETQHDGTEKVHDETDVVLGQIPSPIFDRSFVVDGRKRFLPSAQFRRKPGVFTFKDNADQYKSEFNLDYFTSSRVPSFAVVMNQDKDRPDFNLAFGGKTTKVPAWHLAKALGAKEEDLEKAMGKDRAREVIAASGGDKEYERSVRFIFDKVKDSRSPEKGREVDLARAEALVREEFGKTKVDPDIMKLNFNKPIGVVGPTAIVDSMAKTFRVATGEEEPSNRDSLAFKQAVAPYDMLAEAVGHEKEVRALHDRISSTLSGMERRLNQPDNKVQPKVKRILGQPVNDKIKNRLTASQVQRGDSGTNPLDAWSQASITTLMGEGAIGDGQNIPESAKSLDGSQLGTIDPTHTPESSYAGINVHLSAKAKLRHKVGSETSHQTGYSEIVTPFLTNGGKTVELSPADRQGKVIGAFDQFALKKGKPTPKDKLVTAFVDGKPTQVKAGQVEFWLPDSGAVLDVSSNLIPFGNSTQGNRAQYAAKQLNQTVPLINPEAPLVQVGAPGKDKSLEELLSADAGAKFSPINGTVTDIVDSGPYKLAVKIKGDDGKVLEMNLPKNFPMPGNTSFSSKLHVEKGQKIKAGDLLSDSTFTKDGVLALGTNLRVAYMPWKTDTFEDSIVISETAAKKMTSEHLHNEGAESARMDLGLKSYNRAAGAPLSKEERDNLDADGVVKAGTKIMPGQVLMVGANQIDLRREEDRTLQRLKLLQGKSTSAQAISPFQKTWGREFEGEVVDVKKKYGRDGKVIGADFVIRTHEEMRAGDKVFGRHGNKGVISRVIPDSEMPKLKGKVEITNAGTSKWRVGQEVDEAEFQKAQAKDPTLASKPATLEIILNPLGVPSRINPSQNLETFLGKVARQNGEKEIVKNFGYDSNYEYVKKKLDDAKVSDTDTIVDPLTGREIPNIGVGVQYITKAQQQVIDKNSARGLGSFNPDTGAVVKGEDGAQLTGELGIYGLLAQNAREVIRDTQLNKTEFRQDVVKALQEGRPIPRSVKYPEAFERFNNYLRAAGVNPTEQDKGMYKLVPITDDDVKNMAKAVTGVNKTRDLVIDKPFETLRGKHDDLNKAAVNGGLFDPKQVGGAQATHWSRFELSTKLPNPVYEQSIIDVLGIKRADFRDIMSGTKEVSFGEGDSATGAKAIEGMLKTVDLDKAREDFLEKAKGNDKPEVRSQAYRAIRMLDTLKENKTRPETAFLRQQVAVLPLNMRGIRKDNKGNVVVDDVNYLYRDIGLIDKELREAREAGLPTKAVAQIESGLYDAMTSLMQTEGSVPVGGKYQGILGTLAGTRWDKNGTATSDPKASFFRKEVLNRRQAFSARAVLTPDNDLGMDEVGLPRQVAAALLEEDILKLNRSAGGVNKQGDKTFTEELDDYIKKGVASTKVEKLLEKSVQDKYVVVKRDPVLHQYGIQGFKPVLLPSDRKAMALNPLVYGGFGADNDGDTLAISLPLAEEAKNEIRDKMLPSKNLFNPSSGQLEYTLSQESISGVARLARRPQSWTSKSFASTQAAEEAWKKNEINIDTGVVIAGKKTTYGRELIDSTLPTGFKLADRERDGKTKSGVMPLDKKAINGLLSDVALQDPKIFPKIADDLRKLGQNHASYASLSVTMDDLKPALVSERKQIGTKLTQQLYDISRDKKLSEGEKERAIKDTYATAMSRLATEAKTNWMSTLETDRPNSLVEMVASGARGNFGQLEQMLMAPVAVLDSQDKVIRTPIMRNYTEGLSASDYWAAANGARKGAVNKVVQVQKPGALSKELINTTMDVVVSEKDCGTRRGTFLDITDGANTTDAVGRTLTSPLVVGNLSFKTGHMLSRSDVDQIQKSAKGSLRAGVRSPMGCASTSGVCQVCSGYAIDGTPREIGFNQGVVAAQSLAERSTQLMISSFHSGGRFDPKGSTAGDLFAAAQSILRMPDGMGGQGAILSRGDGAITKVVADRSKGGYILETKTKTPGAPSSYFIPRSAVAPDGRSNIRDFYKPGMKIEKGGQLTGGFANPKELLEVTQDMDKTKEYMSDRLHDMFKGYGIQRRHVETVVHSMTSTMEVKTPGSSSMLPGQRVPAAVAERMQKQYPGMVFVPVLKGVNVAPRELREDYMSQLNSTGIRRSLTQSAASAATSNLHGLHPVPGMGAAREFNRPIPGSTPGAY